MGHRHMGNKASTKEAFWPRKGAVDKLIHHHKMAWREFFLERANRRDRQNVRHPCPLENINIRAAIEF